MNKKHTERIFNDFPEIFAGRDKPIPESLLLFGFECDDGWYDLVYNLCKKFGSFFLQIEADIEKT